MTSDLKVAYQKLFVTNQHTDFFVHLELVEGWMEKSKQCQLNRSWFDTLTTNGLTDWAE